MLPPCFDMISPIPAIVFSRAQSRCSSLANPIHVSGAAPAGTIRCTALSCASTLTPPDASVTMRSEEHTSELQSLRHLVCRLLLEKKKKHNKHESVSYNQVTAVFPS